VTTKSWRAGWARVVGQVRSLFTSAADIEASEERAAAQREGTMPIAETGDREMVRVSGRVRSVAIGPQGPSASFSVDLYDGTGAAELIWLGQRAIRGIDPGRHLVAQGLMTIDAHGHRVIRNPAYELVPEMRTPQ
jgi:hypothetical protein